MRNRFHNLLDGKKSREEKRRESLRSFIHEGPYLPGGRVGFRQSGRNKSILINIEMGRTFKGIQSRIARGKYERLI